MALELDAVMRQAQAFGFKSVHQRAKVVEKSTK